MDYGAALIIAIVAFTAGLSAGSALGFWAFRQMAGAADVALAAMRKNSACFSACVAYIAITANSRDARDRRELEELRDRLRVIDSEDA